jgi:hypothetical protein
MQIKIYIEEKFIDELSNFLKSQIPYEHSITYYTFQPARKLTTLEVNLFYEDYVKLKDMKIENNNGAA